MDTIFLGPSHARNNNLRCVEKTLFLSNANNNPWTCLQRVPAAVRRLRTIRFFVICVTTTSVLKIVIWRSIRDHGRNIDLHSSVRKSYQPYHKQSTVKIALSLTMRSYNV
jgi:hypothetical protein